MAAITLTVGYIEKRFSLFPHHVQKTNIFTTLTAVDTTQSVSYTHLTLPTNREV